MAQSSQTYRTHRRFFPPFHFFIVPVLLANLVNQIIRLAHVTTLERAWGVVVALALVLLALSARLMALKVQDRVIRLEERMRLQRLLPAGEHESIPVLSTRQLVGLRFASDAEMPELARRCLAGELRSAGEVKRAVKQWRPDYLRV
jgi:uncharacterized protein DUF6526